jgi:hypothetical protein
MLRKSLLKEAEDGAGQCIAHFDLSVAVHFKRLKGSFGRELWKGALEGTLWKGCGREALTRTLWNGSFGREALEGKLWKEGNEAGEERKL